MHRLIWYLTISSAIWTASIGSISTAVGEIYPFQFLVILNSILVFSRKEFNINNIIKFTFFIFSLMFFYGLLSLFWVNDISFSLKKLIHLLTGALFLFQFILIVNNLSSLRRVFLIFSINYYLVLILSIIEIISGNYFHATHFIQTYNTNSLGFHYPIVMFNNTNDLAVFIYLFFPVAAYNLLLIKKFKKIIIFTFYIIIAFIIINTESRLGSALVILNGILYIYYSQLFKINNRKLKITFTIGLIAVGTVLLLVFESKVLSTILNAVTSDTRIILFKMAFNAFSNTLSFGLGIGSLFDITSINIHNYMLEILFEYGLLIFLLYSAWLVILYLMLNKIKSKIFSVNVLIFYLKLNILLLPLWGGISSTITSQPYIWIFYAILIICANIIRNFDKRGDGNC